MKYVLAFDHEDGELVVASTHEQSDAITVFTVLREAEDTADLLRTSTGRSVWILKLAPVAVYVDHPHSPLKLGSPEL